ncbi:hypothetical protein IWQ56_000425 [Coemansia nantahalensis]|nr:hypothetical protein IWQ56_000425 [Coemansia nantahalensis]
MSTAGGRAGSTAHEAPGETDGYARDRDARRRARHRGNPERARFHRQPDADEFVIKVDSTSQVHTASLALVTEMRRISLGTTDALGTEGRGGCSGPASPVGRPYASRGVCLELGAADIALSVDAAAAAVHAPKDTVPDLKAEQPSDEAQDAVSVPEEVDASSEVERHEPAAKSRRAAQRPREGIIADGIEQVVQEVPERMTRSMARRMGVQAPRRYFGEGVSTSQILRPGNGKPARLVRGSRRRRATLASGCPAAAADPSERPGGSLDELEERLQCLCDHSPGPLVADSGHNNHRSLSTATSFSSQTLDDSQNGGSDCAYTSRLSSSPGPAHWQWPLDICRWAHRGSSKPCVLYRRNGALPGGPKTPSPLFGLRRPAAVDELLGQHATSAMSIGEFMAQHDSLAPFMPYVIDNGHNLPASPGVVPINDPATQSLPPLASAEYATQISRLTYMVRSLQAIEAADPGFLSQTRVHLLLDLVMDLEQKFTLPRVDFLRSHAATVRAIGMHTQSAPESYDASWAVGCADAVWSAQQPPQSAMATVEHIKGMACALPRVGRAATAAATAATTRDGLSPADALSSHTTCDTSVLGDRLKPDGAFWTGMRESTFDASTYTYQPHTDAGGAAQRVSSGSQLYDSYTLQLVQPDTYDASAQPFDPKLHPVLQPSPMILHNDTAGPDGAAAATAAAQNPSCS